MRIKDFGKNTKGDKATLYVFENQNGMEMHVTDFGATLQKLYVPDKYNVKKEPNTPAGSDIIIGSGKNKLSY